MFCCSNSYTRPFHHYGTEMGNARIEFDFSLPSLNRALNILLSYAGSLETLLLAELSSVVLFVLFSHQVYVTV